MELELIRNYFPEGTNGAIFCQARHLVYAIELPWKDNQTGVSCIPEGKYPLTKRHSPHFGWHLLVNNVPARKDILIHPANDAQRELRGCIAPVSAITGIGKGARSKEAFAILNALVFPALGRNEPVFLTIKF